MEQHIFSSVMPKTPSDGVALIPLMFVWTTGQHVDYRGRGLNHYTYLLGIQLVIRCDDEGRRSRMIPSIGLHSAELVVASCPCVPAVTET